MKNLTSINGEYVTTFSYDELKELFGEETSKNVVFEIHAVGMDNEETVKMKTAKITIVVEEEGGKKPQFPTITVMVATITVTAIIIAILLYKRKLKIKTHGSNWQIKPDKTTSLFFFFCQVHPYRNRQSSFPFLSLAHPSLLTVLSLLFSIPLIDLRQVLKPFLLTLL